MRRGLLPGVLYVQAPQLHDLVEQGTDHGLHAKDDGQVQDGVAIYILFTKLSLCSQSVFKVYGLIIVFLIFGVT